MRAPVGRHSARPAQGRRIGSVDIAKGIGMLCIVAGHIGLKNAAGTDVLNAAVFQFHVPIFYLIAGYFLSTKRPFGLFVKQKAHRLLGPYVATVVLIGIVLIILRLVNGHLSPPAMFHGFREFALAALYGCGSKLVVPEGVTIIGAIWFLEALFVGLIEVRALMPYKVACPVAVVALAVASMLTRKVLWLPFSVQAGFYAGLFIYAGVLLRKVNLFRFEWRRSVFCLVFLALLTVFVLAYVNKITVSAASAWAGPHYLGLAVAVSSSIFAVMLSQLIDLHARPLARFLTFWGRNSLVLLSVHLVMLDCGFKQLLIFLGVPNADPLMFCVNFAAQLLIGFVTIELFRRAPLLKRIFF